MCSFYSFFKEQSKKAISHRTLGVVTVCWWIENPFSKLLSSDWMKQWKYCLSIYYQQDRYFVVIDRILYNRWHGMYWTSRYFFISLHLCFRFDNALKDFHSFFLLRIVGHRFFYYVLSPSYFNVFIFTSSFLSDSFTSWLSWRITRANR